ncbi:MAG: hypothetical protein QOF51_692 [Chloroflexota bacterium]|jgi:S1-C subfamily serine protease|nr:hypothetical protein [Chloroflexota bacterium]
MSAPSSEPIIFTTPTCSWCRKTKEFLRSRSVPFQERDVSVDQSAAQQLYERSGQLGVPVTLVGDEVIVGFDQPKLERLAQRYASTGAASRPGLGLRVRNVPGGEGAEVGGVRPGSPAERASLRAGDVVHALGGQVVRSADDLERLARELKPGARLEAQVSRGDRPLVLPIAM